MRLIYSGSEVPSNRKLLIDSGVQCFGWSYARAAARGFPKTKKFSFSDYYPEGSLIVVHAGITEVKDGVETAMADYQDFVVEHIDEVAGVVEFNGPGIDPELVAEQRPFWSMFEEKFWPVWRPDLGFADLAVLTEEFPEIAVPNADAYNIPTHQISGHMRNATSRLGTSWHGLGIASPESLSQSPLTTAMTGSWQSGMRRGETIVWDGTRLVRYPAKMKDQARSRYKAVIEKAGLDYDAILADDNKEVTRLAIWSYQQLEMDMDKKKPGNNPFRVIEGGGDPSADDDVTNMLVTGLGGFDDMGVDHSTDVMRKPESAPSRLPQPRGEDEKGYLPTFRVEGKEVVEKDESGRDVIAYVPVLSSTSTSMRQCNTCFVAANCPAFKPNSECAFSLPVEVKTKDQLIALLQAIIEMQGSRVAFARFGEELNGGYPDPNVSQEIDRLFKLVESLKKMEDNKEFVRMTFERSGGAGVLSSIFGDRAAVLKELDGGGMTPDQTNQIIQQTLDPQ